MAVKQYSLVAHDWLNLEYIINDLTRRIITQELGTTSSPTFEDVTITGLSGTTITTESVETSIEELDAAISGLTNDHGELEGLADDDHEQYLLVDGTRAMAGDLDLDSYDIDNIAAVNADNAYVNNIVRASQVQIWPDALGGSSDGYLIIVAEGSSNYLTLEATDAGVSTIASVEQLYLKSGDNDFTFMEYLYGDYLRINVDGAHPKITAYSGLIDFDDEDLTVGGTLNASAGKVRVEDGGTTRPGGDDGYVGVAEIGGDGRIYFVVEGQRYYVSGTADSIGIPMGLLLALTYSS